MKTYENFVHIIATFSKTIFFLKAKKCKIGFFTAETYKEFWTVVS